MSAVDERVVRMEFDNKQFEKNIKESIKSLDDLDKQLGLVDDDGAFDKLDKKSKRVDFSHLLSGLNKVSGGFSALEVVAIGALTRIGSKITDVITQYAGMLTFKQIGSGFSKYETEIESVQTIMAATAQTWQKEAFSTLQFASATAKLGKSKTVYEDITATVIDLYNAFEQGGASVEELAKQSNLSAGYLKDAFRQIEESGVITNQLDYVSASLERLNWFTDETSYNYADLVSTIGKFTSTGQGLDQSVTAMQGIANWAAVSGQNAQTATRATYNLAQALATGTVKLQDWKSIEGANMATLEFKQTALDTAVELGQLTKKTNKAGKDIYYYTEKTAKGTKKVAISAEKFNESLKYGWFKSDVLMSTLDKYGAFTDKLYDTSKEFGTTATATLNDIDTYAKIIDGTITDDEMGKWQQRLGTLFNMDTEEGRKKAEEYQKVLEALGDEENDFGRKAFEAGQNAKTFKDVIDALKDAISTQWMNIFRELFGNLETAIDFWGLVYEQLDRIFVEPVRFIKEVLEGWNNIELENGKIVSGSEKFRQSILNILEAVNGLLEPFKILFGGEENIDNSARALYKFSVRLEEFTSNLIPSKSLVDQIVAGLKIVKVIFTGVFKILKPTVKIIGAMLRLAGSLFKVVVRLFRAVSDVLSSDTESIIDSIANTVSKAVDWVVKKLDLLTDWIDKHVDFDALIKIVGKVKKAFITAWDGIKDAAMSVWEIIEPYVPSFEDISNALQRAWEVVKQFLPSWEQVVDSLKEGWQIFKNVATTIWKFLYPYIQQVGDALKKFWGSLSGFISGFAKADDKLGYIKDNIKGLVDAFLEWKRNSKFLRWITDRLADVKELILDVKDAFTPKDGSKKNGGQFLGIAYLVTSIAMLIALMVNVSRITKGIQNISNTLKNFSKTTKRIATFVGLFLIIKAITSLVQALTEFCKLDYWKIAEGVGAVLVIGAGLVFFAKYIKQIMRGLSEKKINLLRRIMFALAITLVAIAGSLWIVSQSNGDDLAWKALTLVGLLTAVVMAAYALSKFVGDIKWDTLLTLVILAGVILVAAIAIKKVGSLNAVQFERAQNLILIIGAIALAAMIVGGILKKGSETMRNIGITVLAMAASLLLIVLALDKLKTINLDLGMVGLIFGILTILAILAAIPVYMGKFAKNNDISSKQMLQMAATVTTMTISLMLIALALGYLAKSMAKNGISSGDMLVLALTISLIMLALGGMALLLANAAKVASDKGTKGNSMKQTAKAISSMVTSVLLIVAAIAVLAKLGIGVEDVAEPIFIVGAIMLMLGVLVYAMASASQSAGKNGIKSGPIIAIAIAIIAIVGTLMVLSKMLEKEGNRIYEALGVVCVIAIGLAVALSMIAKATSLSDKGIQWAPIAVLVLGIMGIMHMLIIMAAATDQDSLKNAAICMTIVIGALALLFLAAGLMQKFSKEGSVLKTVGTIIAIAVALAAATLALYMLKDVDKDTLINAAIAIVGVMVVMGILAAVMGAVGGTAAVGILAIAAAVLIVAVAFGVVAIAANIATAALPKLAEGVVLLGDAIESISATPGQVISLCTALLFLGTFGTAAMIGISIASLIFAAAFVVLGVGLNMVATALPPLSEGIAMLAEALSAVTGKVLLQAILLTVVFGALMVGGILLGIGLAAAGAGFIVVGIGALMVAGAIAIAALSISALVTSLALLAEGIALIINLVKGGDAASEVKAFSDSVKDSGDAISDTLAKAGGAEGGSFDLKNLFNFDMSSLTNSLDISSLKDSLMGGLTGTDGLFGGDFSSMLSGDLTSSLSGAFGDIDTSELMGSFSGSFGDMDFTSMFSEMGLGDSFMSGITSSVSEEGMSDSADNLVESFTDEMTSTSNMSESRDAGKQLALRGSVGARTTRDSYERAGGYCASGLIQGVSDKISSADLVGTKLATALIEAAKETLKVKSPSRAFYEMGMYVDMGLASGMDDYADVAVKSASNMAIDSMGAVSEILANTINNDYANPVIRPTLDLSNVTAGASRISSMFGQTHIGVDGEVGSATAQGGVTNNFIQNNYSPKALNRIEIYRQTKNQISAASSLVRG